MKNLEWNEENINEIAKCFLAGNIVAQPTDTLYGVLACALKIQSVERVYKLKGRNPSKPVIILIADLNDLEQFGVKTTNWQMEQLQKYWPGKVSIVLPCLEEKYEYLHRGTKTLAFRLPDDQLLRKLLSKTGPLIAPSANPEGLEPALEIGKIKEYFGEDIDSYVNAGVKNSAPSTLISLIDDKIEVLRGEIKTD